MKKIFRHIENLFLEIRWFHWGAVLVAGFVVSFFIPALFPLFKALFYLWLGLLLFDISVLYATHGIRAVRELPDKLSNGDENPIEIMIVNRYPFRIKTKIIDEIPVQFQKRDFLLTAGLRAGEEKHLTYHLRPVERGIYRFCRLLVFVAGPLGMASRRYVFYENAETKVYPSVIQLRKFDLAAMAYRPDTGIKKVRRLGHTMEFEQIKDYVSGDDIRTINWKATAKRNKLMVNQYQDERSQPVYSIIDKGRVMQMPFEGMSLLDYAINAALVVSNVILKKQDKAGIFTFSHKVENRVAAGSRNTQMQLIFESLYAVETDFSESDYSILHVDIKRNLSHRSLLFLYTNFETLDGLERQLPYLKSIAKNHVLVVVFFLNTELQQYVKNPAEHISEIYGRTLAQKFLYEKQLIVKELRRNGIYALLTAPQALTSGVINQYLAFKARGVI